MPYPLIFGAIVDSTCKIWENTCGKKGNCWLYDIDKFRVYFHGASLAFLTVGTLFGIMVVFYADSMTNFYDDDEDEIENKADLDNNEMLIQIL